MGQELPADDSIEMTLLNGAESGPVPARSLQARDKGEELREQRTARMYGESRWLVVSLICLPVSFKDINL